MSIELRLTQPTKLFEVKTVTLFPVKLDNAVQFANAFAYIDLELNTSIETKLEQFSNAWIPISPDSEFNLTVESA